jgi:hypothetical protein
MAVLNTAVSKLNTKTNIVQQKKLALKDEGNIKPEILNEIIVNKKGKPDLLAIDIYVEVRSWYKLKKTIVNGNVVYSSKLKGHGFQIGYEYFANKYKVTSETIRTKLVLLEELGLLTREFRTEYFKGKRFNNTMYLLVWKDTPHFYSEIGLEKPKKLSSISPENQGHLSQNSLTPIQKNLDNIYVIPNNQPKEIPHSYANGGISESSIITTETNTRACDPVQKNQQQNNATFAPCSLTQQEQVALTKTEEKHQSVTNCSQLTSQEEKAIELDRKQRTSENTGMFAMSELMNQLLNEPQKEEEIPEMKLEEIPQLTDKQERAMLLSKALYGSFGEQRSNEIQDDYKFIETEPQKVCIQTKAMLLNDIEKAKIRKCIQSVYGEDVTIAMQLIEAKPQAGKVVETMPSHQRQSFQAFKSAIPDSKLITLLTNPLVKATENSRGIIIEAAPFFIDQLTEAGNMAVLEDAVVKTRITLELNYKGTNSEYANNTKKPIVLSLEKILKDREWLENHRKSLQEKK